MLDAKKLYQYLNLLGSLTLAFTIPWIIFKVVRAIHLKWNYNALLTKVVVITGASSGLGEALAHEFYKQGCQVVLCARRRQELERVRTDLMQTHPTLPTIPPIVHPLDLSDINTLPTHIEKILAVTGKIDILINNGGISHRGSILETQPDVDIKIMLVNYFGSVALTKGKTNSPLGRADAILIDTLSAVLPSMIKNQSGHVVFVSSIQGLVALPERSAYCASKHALQAFSDSLRAEVASRNILVTIASPGYVKTELSRNALTGTGDKHGVMDPTTEAGYSADYVATQISRAIVLKKKEVVISSILPKIAIFLRKYLPSLYFYVMAKRAEKARKFK